MTVTSTLPEERDGRRALGALLLFISAYRAQRIRAALTTQRPLPTDAWTIWVLAIALVAVEI